MKLNNRNIFRNIIFIAFATLFIGSESDCPFVPKDPTLDLNGIWIFTVDVITARDACTGEINSTYTHTIKIVHYTNPSSLTLSGFHGNNSNKLEGSLSVADDDTTKLVTAWGEYPEDYGITTTRYTLRVVTHDSLAGGEIWEWESTEIDTSGGGNSIVTARRVS